jgi:hypothetical protein
LPDRISFLNPDGSIFEVHSVPLGMDAQAYADKWVERERKQGESPRDFIVLRMDQQKAAARGASMNSLLNSTRKAVAESNWYAGLTMALTLPDIAVSLENADGRTNCKRYAAWFDKWLDGESKFLRS